MKVKFFGLVLVGFIFGSPLSAQSSSEKTSLAATLDSIRLKYDLPALAAAIVTSKGVADSAVVGVRKYGDKTPATINDQFHLGSDTKAMTATLIAMLVEDGKLTWTSTLEQIFPDLAPAMDPAYRKVTVEQLLAQRSGFSDESWPKGKSFEDVHRLPGTPREQRFAYLKLILSEPPAYAPGSKFLYSNRNYAVAGAIAERVANASWEDLMRERLFRPLGMDTCGFGAMGTPGKIDQPWQHKNTFLGRLPIEPGPLADNPPAIAPAATVHCSILDWAKFIQLHLAGEKGESKLLKPATIKRLHTASFGGEYAFGWLVVQRDWAGGRALTHAGSNTQNFAVVWMAPEKEFAVLVMTNQGGGKTPQACDEAASALIQRYVAAKQ